MSTAKADMGIAAGADLHEAYYGVGLWKGKQTTNFRIVGNSLNAVANCVVMDKSEIKNLKDLDGKKVSIGSPGSASAGFAKRFLVEAGVNVVRQAASRLRRRYRELLREEVAQTLAEPGDVEDEIRSLFECWGAKASGRKESTTWS